MDCLFNKYDKIVQPLKWVWKRIFFVVLLAILYSYNSNINIAQFACLMKRAMCSCKIKLVSTSYSILYLNVASRWILKIRYLAKNYHSKLIWTVKEFSFVTAPCYWMSNAHRSPSPHHLKRLSRHLCGVITPAPVRERCPLGTGRTPDNNTPGPHFWSIVELYLGPLGRPNETEHWLRGGPQ